MVRFFVALLLLAFSSLALAEETYRDDRSTAANVVRSLYNAINRREYARAFGYFSEPPAKDYSTYVQGFADTARADVITGEVLSDGAAGSIYYSVPTAIKATDSAGGARYFAGCYTVRASNASIQDPPFKPLQIEKGVLKPSKVEDFDPSFLPKCGEGESADTITDFSIEKAKALFVSSQQGLCDKVEATRGGLNEPTVYKFKYKDEGSSAEYPERTTTLFHFNCSLFAYNASSVFYIHNDFDGLQLLSFAEPNLDIVYQTGDSESRNLKSMKVNGFRSKSQLINADVDEKSQSITSFSKWRGLADASSSGTWIFNNGEFILSNFQVDPTYNDEMDSIDVFKDGKNLTAP